MPPGWGGDESPPASGVPTEPPLNPTPAAPSSLGPPCAASPPPFALLSPPGPSQGWLSAIPRTCGPCTCPPTSPCTQLLSPSFWSHRSWQFRAGGTRSRCRVTPTALTLAAPLSPASSYPGMPWGTVAISSPWPSPPARCTTLRCSCSPPTCLPQPDRGGWMPCPSPLAPTLSPPPQRDCDRLRGPRGEADLAQPQAPTLLQPHAIPSPDWGSVPCVLSGCQAPSQVEPGRETDEALMGLGDPTFPISLPGSPRTPRVFPKSVPQRSRGLAPRTPPFLTSSPHLPRGAASF